MRKALIVGIDRYPFAPLQCCVRDATEVAALLRMPEYGFSVTLLLDAHATRRAIRDSLVALFDDSTYALFYYSGHGGASDLGAYLHSIDASDLDEGVDLDILRKLADSRATNGCSVLYLLDCCHSGAARIRGARSHRPLADTDIEVAIPSLSTGCALIAACTGDQLAWEDASLGHGVFTKHLLTGLLGDAADHRGQLSVPALYDYISRQFESEHRQQPVFRGDFSGRIILGSGFPENPAAYSPAQVLDAIETEARLHLEQYQHRAADFERTMAFWKSEGYRAACAQVETLARWFHSKESEHPALRNRVAFKDSKATLSRRIASLSSFDIGTKTACGLAEERLGQGTFGAVWRVRRDDGQNAAYKIYHPQDLLVRDKLSRFEHGFRAMTLLDHPHIVKVSQYTQAPVGFAMDYVDGPNLRHFNRIEDPKEVISLLLTVANTLRHAHGRGVVHRDVKPENIVMALHDNRWQPHLTDFDLAWFSTSTVLTMEGMGSFFYAAPEQLAKPGSDAAHAATTDVFAFGQLCYFVLTSSDPIPLGQADNSYALRRVLNQGWVEAAARPLAELYARCTAKAPKDRPQDFVSICDILGEAWQALDTMSPSAPISKQKFFRELAFMMVGLDSAGEGNSSEFRSLSGKTRVLVRIDDDYQQYFIRYSLYSIEKPYVDGAGSFEEMRQTLLRRLDAVIKAYPGATKKPGTQSPFEVFVDHRGVQPTLMGVRTAHALMSRAVDALERN